MPCQDDPTFAGKSHTQAKKSSTGPRDLANSSQCRREVGYHMEDLLNERDLGGLSQTRQYARQLRFSKEWSRSGSRVWKKLVYSDMSPRPVEGRGCEAVLTERFQVQQ